MNKISETQIQSKLAVRKINCKPVDDIVKTEELLDSHTDYQRIESINWPSFPYRPVIKFKIAYCSDKIWLKFVVTEVTIRAKETQINSDVYKDSCVEFFISPDQNEYYYNFEFNCIGTPYLGFGVPGKNRTKIDPEIVKRIHIKSSLGNSPFDEKNGGHHWELMLIIPKECFVFHSALILEGLNASANFYKCGDETLIPHFVTWNPINSDLPNYHMPEYFGELQFET